MTPTEALVIIGGVALDVSHPEHGWAMRDPAEPGVWLAVDREALDELVDMIRDADMVGGLELDEVVHRWSRELAELTGWCA